MTDDDEYKVGYKNPPKDTRFKKGQSGNPKGRRKGVPFDPACVLHAELSEKITIIENGKRKKLTKMEAIVKQMVNGAASGNHKDRAALSRSMDKLQKYRDRNGPPPEEFAQVIIVNDVPFPEEYSERKHAKEARRSQPPPKPEPEKG